MRSAVFFQITLALAILFDIGAAITVNDCPPGLPRDSHLQVYKDSCYLFVTYKNREYQDAELDCAQDGGTLVIVKDNSVASFLVSELLYTYFHVSGVWIGLTDRQNEQEFVWADGQPLGTNDYQDWAPSQGPNHVHDSEDCVTLQPYYLGLWFVESCSNAFFGLSNHENAYVCEYKAGPTTTAVIPTVMISAATTSTTANPTSAAATTPAATQAATSTTLVSTKTTTAVNLVSATATPPATSATTTATSASSTTDTTTDLPVVGLCLGVVACQPNELITSQP